MAKNMLFFVVLPFVVSLALGDTCDNSTFPTDASGDQILGLDAVGSAKSFEDCQQACCQKSTCEVFQFEPPGGRGGCWIGRWGMRGPSTGWSGRGKAQPPPPPPAPPGLYVIDDTPGLGLRWEGVGAISGGGATSKLLKDYDPAVASDILDFLFLPNFGLNLQMLKVEIGGDADATEGAEPSHMHFDGDLNYNRGYEWWLMNEAKKRNPGIKLYGLPWSFPGWLDPSATHDKPAKNPFADANTTANYSAHFILGAQSHNLAIDYIGQWNERNAPGPYVPALQAAVAKVSPNTIVLNRLPHYPGTTVTPDPQGCQQYQWNTTDGSRWADEEGSVADGQSARCLARCLSRNYVTECRTATFQWHLISSFYDYLPWKRCGVAVANTPWSGSYEITSPTWALAHTSQFAPIGWRYTMHNSGVQLLPSGGSVVTRVSQDLQDFSIVLEKMDHASSYCARGSHPSYDTYSEVVTLQLKGKLLAAAQSKGLYMWYSNLTDGNDSNQLFVNKGKVSLENDTLKVPMFAGDIYTITTLSTGGKGNHTVPAAKPLQIPYTQDFDNETLYSPPKYWYDQMGAWEIHTAPAGGSGQVMRQMVPVWPACWGYSCTGPTTYFGPSDYLQGTLNISFAVYLEDDAKISLNSGKNVLCSLDSETGDFVVGKQTGTGAKFTHGMWHQVSVSTTSSGMVLMLDGAILGKTTEGGFDGALMLQLSRYVFANIDNFSVTNSTN
eukprot:m.34107 g.34107  ORF g.34107 m.34107 type:complete len:723 (+) comp8671_c0_seq2:162-2330(+)